MPDGGGAEGDERVQHALELAYRQLNRRDRTELEIDRHLERRGIAPATRAAASAVLREQGYLDDVRYAERFVDDKRRLDGWGTERIVRRLEDAGVDRELVDRALGSHGREDELEAARALLRRRFPELSGEARERQRALAVLLRKGYALELAADAIRAHGRERRVG